MTGPLDMRDTGFAVAEFSRLAVPYADGQPEPVCMTDGLFVPLEEGGARFAPSRALNPSSYTSGGAGTCSLPVAVHCPRIWPCGLWR